MALTGPFAAVGQASKAGFEASVEEINANGGIDGRKVELKIVDDQGSATTAVSLLQKALTSNEKPDVVFPGNSSDVTLALCPILQRAGIVAIGQTGSEKINDPKLCGTTFSTTWQVTEWQPTAAEYMKAQGLDSTGLLVTNDAYGESAINGAEKAFTPAGIDILGTQVIAPDALDASAQLRKLYGDNPKSLVMEANGAVIGTILDSRQKVNDQVPMIVGAGAASNNVRAFTSAAATKNVVLTAFAAMVEGKAPDPEKFDAAVARIREKLGGPFKLTNIPYVLSYDIPFITKEALRRSNGESGEALKEALETFASDPPKNGGWVARKDYQFSSSSHFAKSTIRDFAMAAPTELNENGQVQALDTAN